MRPATRLALGLGLGLALVLAHVAVARAHAILLSAAPNPNGLFPADAPPAQVRLTFSEQVVPTFSDLRVLDATGTVMTLGDMRSESTEQTSLAVALRPLPPGIYTVAWRVLSTVDGHTTSGSYVFGVGVTPVGQSATSQSTLSAASIANRILGLMGQVILLGLFTFHLFVWQPALRETNRLNESAGQPTAPLDDGVLSVSLARQSLRVGWIGLGLVGLGLVVALADQRELIGGASVSERLGNVSAWLGTRYGGAWLVRLFLSVALGFTLADLGAGLQEPAAAPPGPGGSGRGSWVWWAGLGLSVAAGLAGTSVSHSAALPAEGGLAVLSDAGHGLAAGVWVGGLVQLLLAVRLARTLSPAARGELNLSLVLNFSTLAALAVGLLLVSGGYLAWQHVGKWAALFRTTYGLTLLAKIGLALPAFAVAGVNLLVIRPRLEAARRLPDSDPPALHRRFGRLVLVESGFALAAVAAAGLLTDLQPGRDTLLLAEQSQVTASQPADDLDVRLTVDPGQWGRTNTFDVYLIGTDRQPVTNAREVSLRFTFLDRPVGTSEVTAEPAADGHYRAGGSFLSLGGSWQVEVTIRRSGAYDAFADFELATTPEGIIRSMRTTGTIDRLVAWLDRSGGWLVGAALGLFSLAWVIPAVWATRGRVSWALAAALVPSLLAMVVGVLQIVQATKGVPAAPSGDPRALALLAESDAAMNQLASLQLLRTTRGGSGAVLTETVRFQAPNLFHDQMSNGAENMAQGAMYYYLGIQAQQWEAVRQNEPFRFPNFELSRQAVDARLGRLEEIDGRAVQHVVFTVYLVRNPVAFARWIDVETKLILREIMDAPGHYMVSIYQRFNEPVAIVLPAASEIRPTPTTIPVPSVQP